MLIGGSSFVRKAAPFSVRVLHNIQRRSSSAYASVIFRIVRIVSSNKSQTLGNTKKVVLSVLAMCKANNGHDVILLYYKCHDITRRKCPGQTLALRMRVKQSGPQAPCLHPLGLYAVEPLILLMKAVRKVIPPRTV